MSIGDALAEARSRADLTITQVSQRTCIRETIIRGIERDDFSACGGDFYARGHIRSIARAVGADPDELVREYDAAYGAPQAIRAAEVFQPATPIRIKEGRSPNWSVAIALVLAGVIGFGVYQLVIHRPGGSPAGQTAAQAGGHGTGQPAAAATTPAATATPSATPTAHRHRLVVRLTAIQDCWVEFTKPDGAYLWQVYVTGGSTRTWKFRHAVHMQIGNPGGILLTVNGKDLGRPGSVGQPLTLTLGPHKKLPSQTG